MKTSTMCTVQNRHHAERVVELLLRAGFSNKDISALLPSRVGTGGSARVYQTAETYAASTNDECDQGGALGLLKSFGALVIPGLGQLALAGPLFATLSAAAAKTVGLTDAFIRMGIPAFESRRFEAKVRGSNLLIFVHTNSTDAQLRVIDIFNAAYAVDICSAQDVAIARTLQLCSPLPQETAQDFSSTG